MVVPVSSPQVVAFLEHLSANRPDILCLFGRDDIPELIERFEASQNRSFDERYWRDFIDRMKQRRGLVPLERVVLGPGKGHLSGRDPLARYRDIPNHVIFLHDSMSDELREWLHRHVLALHERSGDAFDVYEYTIEPTKRRKAGWSLARVMGEDARALASATRSHLKKLSPIPGADWSCIEGLPSVLVWSSKCQVVLPLVEVVQDDARMARLVDGLVLLLSRGEFTEFDVDELRRLIDVVSYPDFPAIHVEPEPASIFVSYRRTERPLAENIVNTLIDGGATVWYDQFIAHAELFRSRTYAQIKVASTVLVCWTHSSAHSPWVRLEAEVARKQGKLLPLLFDSQPPPSFFEGIQGVVLGSAADFTGKEPAFQKLVEELSA